jgi:predicted  nucleic acid-binding Zn-ribbon protein
MSEEESEERIIEVPICNVYLCKHSQQAHTANGCLLCGCIAFKYKNDKIIKKV